MLNQKLYLLGTFAVSMSSSVFTWMMTENYWHNKIRFSSDNRMRP